MLLRGNRGGLGVMPTLSPLIILPNGLLVKSGKEVSCTLFYCTYCDVNFPAEDDNGEHRQMSIPEMVLSESDENE